MKKIESIFLSLICIFHGTASATDSEMEVIEVHAQKRGQKITDVAIAVSKLDGERLAKEQIKDTTALGHYVPNVKITQNAAEGTAPAVNIRGIGLIDYNTSNTSPVAVYVDGITSGSANNQIVNLFDVESVEVLRGPQGTLFGRNSTGGAILIRSNRPQDSVATSIKLGAANQSSSRIEAMLNLPISDNVATRFAINHNDYEYTTHNLLPTSPTAGLKQTDYRALLDADFNDINLAIKFYGSNWRGIVQPVGSLGIYRNPTTGEKCPANMLGSNQCFDAFGFNDGSEKFHDVMVNNDSPHDSDIMGSTIELSWQVNPNWQLVSLTGFNDLERTHAFNCDSSPAQLCEGELGLQSDAFSQEVRLQSNFSSHYLMLGAYYTKEEIVQENYNDILRDLRGILDPSLTTTFFYDNKIEIESKALFGQVDYQLNQDLQLTLGVRYTDESTAYKSVGSLNLVVDPNDLNGVVIPYYVVSGKPSDDALSGKLAFNYQLGDIGSIYYSLSNGYKSGGYYGGFISTPEQAELAAYEPETVVANEIGGKFSLINNDWTLNWAIFHYDYQDQQVFMNQASKTDGAPPLQLLENVASSSIYGLELENNVYLSNSFSVDLNLGYLPHAEFDEYTDPLGVSLTNHLLPFTSEWDILVQANYNTTIGQFDIGVNLGANYQSDFYFDQNQSEYAKQSSFTLWHSHLYLEYNQWRSEFWVKNLFDTEYSHLKFDLSSFLGMVEDFKGEGRRYGINVSYHF